MAAPKPIVFGYIVCAILAIAFIITGGIQSGIVTEFGSTECCDQIHGYSTHSIVNSIVFYILVAADILLLALPTNRYKHKKAIFALLLLLALLVPIEFRTSTGEIGGWRIFKRNSVILTIEECNREIRIYPNIPFID